MTSSLQPPVLNPPLGTPSSEWSTESNPSLDPPPQESPQNTTPGQVTDQSPDVTPGNELPGAFPDRDQGAFPERDTAKQYLPTGVINTVGTFLGNNNGSQGTTGTDQEVRASEHDVYHKTSLPSQELRGALPHEHVGGVGSLPGASIEKSVALLPDEQAEWSEWNTFAGRNTPGYETPSNLKPGATSLSQIATKKAASLGVAAGIVKADVPPKPKPEDVDKGMPEDVGKGYPETMTSSELAAAQQAVGNIKPVSFDIKQADDVSMPSTERQGQQPGEHTNGAGSLPGSKGEQEVAVLPDERAAKTTETVHPEHPEEPSEPTDKPKDTGVVGVGGATDSLKEDTQSRLPKEPPTETETVASEQKTASPEPGQRASVFHESDEPAGIQRSEGSEGSTEGHRKASLMDKISGGMKVVSGKLGHDKFKVEEGKKLMHGQSA